MRLSRSDTVGGLPAVVVRTLMKQYGRGECGTYDAEQILAKHGIDTPAHDVLTTLTELGYLETGTDWNSGSWWTTTIQGNALGMASFGKPITRRTADRLLEELIGRAKAYNADPAKLMYVRSLTVFGSYLNDTDQLGDLDIGLDHGRRTNDPAASRRYARASGRTFNSFIDELFWPQQELFLHLKNRSAAISLTTEDLSAITDRTRVVYTIGSDPEAIQP